jgi:hypothetical protein
VRANPGSTAGDVATALGPQSQLGCQALAQLAKSGELVAAPRLRGALARTTRAKARVITPVRDERRRTTVGFALRLWYQLGASRIPRLDATIR